VDDSHDNEQPTTSDSRTRARELFRRTAPVLRDVNARIERNEALRETRDALVDKAGELVQRADDALGKMTAIEGTVVERDDAGATPRPAAASTPSSGSMPRPAAAGERERHWTKQRVARMATAAATEAVRPARPLIRRETKTALLVGAIAGIFVATVLRRR
jgi:hypothetical protein